MSLNLLCQNLSTVVLLLNDCNSGVSSRLIYVHSFCLRSLLQIQAEILSIPWTEKQCIPNILSQAYLTFYFFPVPMTQLIVIETINDRWLKLLKHVLLSQTFSLICLQKRTRIRQYLSGSASSVASSNNNHANEKPSSSRELPHSSHHALPM